MVAYYPPQISISKIVSQYPELEMVNEDEQTRLEDIEFKKKRGKGAPKKQKKGMYTLFLDPPVVYANQIVGESRRSGGKRR